ncbi:MAG: InlB B-repeat-containing protein, partial [Clostridia bacterium]|nr:InlB B-repeat-containing protein [Clostridia bacterium]
MNRLSGITNKSEKGISIATLVVTIIVLIILAGITIWLLFENGLLGNADKAVNIQKISEEKEAIEFAYAEANIDYLNKGTPIYANIMKDKLLYYDDKVETRDLEIEEKEEDDDVLINNENIVGYIEIIFSTGNKYIVAAVDNFNYTIKYNLNGGTLSLPNPETYNSDTETFTLNNPTRNEAEFAGWTGTDLTERTLYVTINKGSKGDREYKANWKGKIYHIIYDANGGENPPEIQSKEIGNEITLSYEKPTREGYTFKGWSTKLYSTEVEYASGATFDKDEDIILYAVWELTNYNIVYDLDGGNVSGNPSSYNINSETFTLNNPTKDNFTFKGWTGTGLNGKQLNVTIQKGSSGNLSFKANYGIVNYIIDEVQYATTLEEAVELASNNSTIKIISDVNDESNQIEINKNIKLQLQGHTIRTSQTINIAENAAVQILSGNIKNDVSTTIINQGTLTIGTLENEVLETPTIEGKNIGVENKGTFNFYDGQIIGEKAIKGRIQNTPEQYFTIINNNGGKEIASLIMISDPVARIDDIYYNSLSKAVERQRTGEIVTLIKGIALDATLNITKDTTIDLNGFSISTTQNSYLISNNSNLELIDSAGGGEIFGTTHDVIENNENANLVINGAAVTIKASGAYNLYKNAIYNCKNAKLELKAGIIKADASYLNCISNNAGIVKITGGTLQATKTNNRGIYNEDATGEAPANGRINIQSGIIDAYYGIYNKASNIEDVNINGGTFTGTYSVYLDGSGNVNINNGDFQVVIYNKNSGKIIFNNGIAKSFTNDANGEIIINDGTITGTIKNTDQGNIKIYGGTIESTIKETITNGSTGTIDINNATIISYHPIVNKSKGTININNSNITYSISEADSKVCYGVSNDSSGSITLENSNIILEKKDNSKKSYGNIYGIYNKTNGRIDLINTSIKVLTNGIATSSNKSIVYGIYNNSGIINYRGTGKIDVKRNLDVSSSYSYSYGVFNDRGTVNIGIKDNNYQKDVLEIDVDDIGLINTNGIITFYDGTISGSTSYNGIINDIESNYKINIENSDKQVMSLISINGDYIAEILETGQRYSTIQDAVNACDTTRKYNIKLIKSTIYFTGEDINIGTGKNILIDVNGSTLKIGTGIINNGLLELTDSNETKGKISINKTVVNNNYLNINGIDAQLLPNDNSLFANNKTGTMDINSSTLSLECEGTSDGSIIAIYNSGSLTINDNTLLTTNSNLYTKAIYNLRGEVNINGGTIETNNQTGAYNIYNEYKLIKDGILINNSGNSDYDVSPTNGNLYFANTSYCTIKVDLTGKSGTYKAKVELLER